MPSNPFESGQEDILSQEEAPLEFVVTPDSAENTEPQIASQEVSPEKLQKGMEFLDSHIHTTITPVEQNDLMRSVYYLHVLDSFENAAAWSNFQSVARIAQGKGESFDFEAGVNKTTKYLENFSANRNLGFNASKEWIHKRHEEENPISDRPLDEAEINQATGLLRETFGENFHNDPNLSSEQKMDLMIKLSNYATANEQILWEARISKGGNENIKAELNDFIKRERTLKNAQKVIAEGIQPLEKE